MRKLTSTLVFAIVMSSSMAGQQSVVQCLHSQVEADSVFVSGLKTLRDALSSALSGKDIRITRIQLGIAKLVATKKLLAKTVRICSEQACTVQDWELTHQDFVSATKQLDTALANIDELLSSVPASRDGQAKDLHQALRDVRTALVDRKRDILCQLQSIAFPIPDDRRKEALDLADNLDKQADSINQINETFIKPATAP
jgi:hypothetical protein